MRSQLVLETDMSTHMKCVADLEMLHLRLVEDCPHLATRSGYAGIQDLLATSHTGPPMCGLQMTRDNVRCVLRGALFEAPHQAETLGVS